MPLSGWYPDPDGTAGRFRYWDGESWSVTTTADPDHSPAPTGAPPPPGDPHNRGWLIALIVLALATILVVVTVLLTTGGLPTRGTATEDTNSASPTVLGWDETSTPTPPPLPSYGGQLVACPVTSHAAATGQPPGRVRSSTLSAAIPDGWRRMNRWEFPFAYDQQSVSTWIVPGVWLADLAVGRLAKSDWAGDVADVATQIAECLATSWYYHGLTKAVALSSEPMEISGHAAWAVAVNAYVDDPPRVGGDRLTAIVVDLGDSLDHYGLFTAACTINEPVGLGSCATVDAAIQTLTVSG